MRYISLNPNIGCHTAIFMTANPWRMKFYSIPLIKALLLNFRVHFLHLMDNSYMKYVVSGNNFYNTWFKWVMNFLFKRVLYQFCSVQPWTCSFPGLLTFIKLYTLWVGLHEWELRYLQDLHLRRSHLDTRYICVPRGTRTHYPSVRVIHYRTSCIYYG